MYFLLVLTFQRLRIALFPPGHGDGGGDFAVSTNCRRRASHIIIFYDIMYARLDDSLSNFGVDDDDDDDDDDGDDEDDEDNGLRRRLSLRRRLG